MSPPDKPGLRRLSISLSADDADAIDAIAHAHGWHRSRVVREAVRMYRRHSVAGNVLSSLHASQPTSSSLLTSRAIETTGLTRAEQRILQGVVEGKTNRQIAHELHLSRQTVKNAVSVILYKLEVDSRTEAAVVALKLGLVDAPAVDTN
jgi:DNA-binding NarL/FixJ family response regulator